MAHNKSNTPTKQTRILASLNDFFFRVFLLFLLQTDERENRRLCDRALQRDNALSRASPRITTVMRSRLRCRRRGRNRAITRDVPHDAILSRSDGKNDFILSHFNRGANTHVWAARLAAEQ